MYVSTIPTSRETTITMISGACPEPMIQSTLTSLRLRTANSVTSTASATSAPVRASSRLLRFVPGCRSRAGFWGGSLAIDALRVIVPAGAGSTPARRTRACKRTRRRGERSCAANTIVAVNVRSRHAVAACATLACTALLAACGGGTKTVTATSSPSVTVASTAATATTDTTATSSAPKTATAPATSSAGTPAATRTAPEPAFTEHQQSAAENVRAAAALVRAHGFTPNDTSEYHAGQTLRVLVGTRTGSGDGYGQQAFFFVGDRYIGTDAKEPSASVKVVSQGETEVTLAYPLYRPSDPLCCPGGGTATVHFQLNNGKLTALDPIPPASSKAGLSRG
jgi:hypothetical protein